MLTNTHTTTTTPVNPKALPNTMDLEAEARELRALAADVKKAEEKAIGRMASLGKRLLAVRDYMEAAGLKQKRGGGRGRFSHPWSDFCQKVFPNATSARDLALKYIKAYTDPEGFRARDTERARARAARRREHARLYKEMQVPPNLVGYIARLRALTPEQLQRLDAAFHYIETGKVRVPVKEVH